MAKAAAERVGAYYYFFPEYAQGRKAVWEGRNKEGLRFLDMIPKCYIKKENSQEMKIEYTNGSIIRIVGTDEKDRFMGTNPIGCVFSEYSLQNPDAFAFVSPILNENDGWLIINGTPRGHNHMYDLEQKVKTLPSWHVSVLTVEDTRLIHEERIKKQIEEDLFLHGAEFVAQEYYVSYTAGVKGAYYSDQIVKARAEGRIAPFLPESHKWTDTFWDLGYGDHTATWFRQLEGNQVRWIDYNEDKGKEVADYVQMLKEKNYKYRTHYLPHDGKQGNIQTGMTTEEMFVKCLREAGVSGTVQVCKKPKFIDGINAVRARFSNYCFNSASEAVIQAVAKLELYSKKWDAKKQVFLEAEHVHDQYSDCADALRTEPAALQTEDSQYNDNNRHRRIKVISPYDIGDPIDYDPFR